MRLKDEDKKQRIKDAVVQLVLRDGIDGISVSKIAKEAGVSSSTIYVYYDSKEAMMAEVFDEYSHKPYGYLCERMRPDMDGREVIETIVRGNYLFSVEHEEIFSFVEQCSRQPGLSEKVCGEKCSAGVMETIHTYQERGVLRTVSDMNIASLLFAPIKFLAMNRRLMGNEEERCITELIDLLEGILVN